MEIDETPDYDYDNEDMCRICGEDEEDCTCEIGEECPDCEGTGAKKDDAGFTIICPTCEGRTYVPHDCDMEL